MSYTPSAPSGSRTATITSTPAGPSREGSTEPGPDNAPPAVGVLKLRGGPGSSLNNKGKGKEKPKRRGVVWDDGVVDNEGMGKKKSKICCIYHKPRAFDESSSESDCSSDDDHGHHRAHQVPKSGKVAGGSVRHGRGAGSDVKEESEESSESDGGAGDGRARPARKTRRPKKNNDECSDHRHTPSEPDRAPNKYDIQPRSGK